MLNIVSEIRHARVCRGIGETICIVQYRCLITLLHDAQDLLISRTSSFQISHVVLDLIKYGM